MPGPRFFRTPNYTALSPSVTLDLARRADQLGYDSLWLADHLILGHDDAVLEGWTTLAALAGSTQRARLGLLQQAHYFRHPALAAKMGATLDQISGGRFIFFAAAAFGETEHHAYGLPYPDEAEERIAATVEGLELTLALWQSESPVTFNGARYQTKDAVCHPRPVQLPHPPVWFGEAHPDTLAACARFGQGWNSLPVGRVALKQNLAALAAACDQVGRDVDDIERSLESQILIVEGRDQVREKLQAMADLEPGKSPDPDVVPYLSGASDNLPESITSTWLIGTPEEISQQLSSYIELGIDHFLLWFMDAPQTHGLELFADTVMPRFATSA
jgi:alkanesulfonate monooxygenase SsuD/methylene tetrahydromethanopterin reductase-like flavin-dependent oxidoreductase (luciferase family)